MAPTTVRRQSARAEFPDQRRALRQASSSGHGASSSTAAAVANATSAWSTAPKTRRFLLEPGRGWQDDQAYSTNQFCLDIFHRHGSGTSTKQCQRGNANATKGAAGRRVSAQSSSIQHDDVNHGQSSNEDTDGQHLEPNC